MGSVPSHGYCHQSCGTTSPSQMAVNGHFYDLFITNSMGNMKRPLTRVYLFSYSKTDYYNNK